MEAGAIEADILSRDIPERGLAAYLAEFLGTLTLVFFITMVVSEFVAAPAPSATPGVAPTQQFVDWAVIGGVHVLALFLLVQTIALVSGAHVNPAVTVALATIRQIRPIDAAIYIAMQLAGGTLGALLTKGLLTTAGKDVHYGTVGLSNVINHSTAVGFGVEALGTFFLVWSIVGVAVNPQGFKPWAGLVIGGTLGLVVMIGGSLTGAGFNPARAFGPSLVAGHWDKGGTWIVIWILAPLVGGIAAAWTYLYLFLTPGKKGPFGMRPVG